LRQWPVIIVGSIREIYADEPEVLRNSKQSLTRLGAHPVTNENVLSYDFRVSESVSVSKSTLCRIDTDSDPEIFWCQFLFAEQRGQCTNLACICGIHAL
jgi:hypothetical protein